jgi:hypothetical protein
MTEETKKPYNAPKRFSVRIDDFIFRKRRIPGNRNMDAKWGYQCSGGSMTAISTRYVWHDNNTPDTFTIAVWSDKDDWTKMMYRLTSSDPSVSEWVNPIMEQYISDMYKYYHKDKS